MATKTLLITLAPYHRNDWHNMTEMAGTTATELSTKIENYFLLAKNAFAFERFPVICLAGSTSTHHYEVLPIHCSATHKCPAPTVYDKWKIHPVPRVVISPDCAAYSKI